MKQINLSSLEESPYQQLLNYNERILKNWIQLESSVYADSSLSFKLLDEVRKTLRQGNQFDYCKVGYKRCEPSPEIRRVQLATSFAEIFILDHTSIYTAHFRILEEEFSQIEISELCSFIAVISSTQKLGCMYNLTAALQQTNNNSLEEVRMAF